ncbi:MFS transporter [Nonomuraea sp. NPDC049152]|uniref:MFS transporter n=1 Tax=Nonomuraea sp. NPDC049152 TaxID=3154350 RepID=UPI0033E6BB01
MSWRRDFWLVFAGSGLATVATRASVAAYPLLALLLTGSPVLAGWVRFASMAPALVFTLPFGVLVDRYDRRRLLVISQLGRAAAIGAFAVTIAMGGPWLPVLCVTVVVEGALTVLHQRALDPAIAEIVPKEHVTWAVSRNEGAQAAATLLGQPAGGFLLGLGNAFPFMAGLVAQVAAAVTILSTRGTRAMAMHGRREAHALPDGSAAESSAAESSAAQNRAAESSAAESSAAESGAAGTGRGVRGVARDMAEGARWIWRDAFLRLAVTVFTSTNVLWQMLGILLIVLARSEGASPAAIGLILGATGVGGVVGTMVAPRVLQHVGPVTVLRLACWLWLGAIAIVAFAVGPLMLAVGWGCVGLVAGILDVATMTYMISSTPQELMGRVTSVPAMLAFGLSPLGALAGGYLLELWGPRPVLLVAAVAMAAIAVLATLTRVPAHPSGA